VTYDVIWLLAILIFLNKYTIESWFGYLNWRWYLTIFAPVLSSGEQPSQPKLLPLPVCHPSDVWRHLNISIFNILYKYKIESWFGCLNRSWYPTIFAPVLLSGEVPSQAKLFPLLVYHPSDIWRHLNIGIFYILNNYKIESWFSYLNRSWYPTIFATVLSSGEPPSQPKLFPLPAYHLSDVWCHLIISNFDIFEQE